MIVKAKKKAKNGEEEVIPALATALASLGVTGSLDDVVADRLVSLIKGWKGAPTVGLKPLVQLLLAGEIENNSQLTAGVQFALNEAFSSDALATVAGIGQVPSEDAITAKLNSLLCDDGDFKAKSLPVLMDVKKGVKGAVKPTMRPIVEAMKATFPFADMKIMSGMCRTRVTEALTTWDTELDAVVAAEEKAKAEQEILGSSAAAPQAASGDGVGKGQVGTATTLRTELEAAMDRLPLPRDNSHNSPEAVKQHLKAHGEAFITRFPPEPNGYIHLGHAKAMNLSFSLARRSGGRTYLRYDDTNPVKESEEYVKGIEEMVRWLGFEPWKVTHSAHYFDKMHALCKKLITQGDAYACACTSEAIKEQRAEHKECPCRTRTPKDSTTIFDDMTSGQYEEGAMCIRMKQDMKSDNGAMLDHACYRVLKKAHVVTGDKWCVYPTYDFEHCVVDALENVTHSLCTTEFVGRRESYYWLLDKLGMWKPHVWEFSALNITYNLMSKRLLLLCVEEGIVDGWDDPRLLTLVGLRRRGVTPRAIKAFCDCIGITTVDNSVDMMRFEHAIRTDCDETTGRTLGVLKPVAVHIQNWEGHGDLHETVPVFPGQGGEDSATRPIFFGEDVVIDEEDVARYQLQTGRPFRLRYGPVLKLVPHGDGSGDDDKDGAMQESEDGATLQSYQATALWDMAEWDALPKKKQVYVHWVVPPPSYVSGRLRVEVRHYDLLFNCADPGRAMSERVASGAAADKLAALRTVINPSSKLVLSTCVVGGDVVGMGSTPTLPPVGTRYQFERTGYYAVDSDTAAAPSDGMEPSTLVLNRIITLREAKGDAK